MSNDSGTYLNELHILLDNCFNLREIESLCFQLGVIKEFVAGTEKSVLIRGLLNDLGQDGRLPELVALTRKERPNLAWPLVPDDFEMPASLDEQSGDKITVGNVSDSYAAIGAGAQVIVNQIQNQIQQEPSAVDELDKSIQIAERLLAEAVQKKLSIYTRLTATNIESRGNPYKALLDYKIEDAPFFYGRSDAIEAMQEKMQESRLTILHSETGSGKTSLLQAGLASRLLAEGRFPLYLRPYDQRPDQFIKKAFLPDYETLEELRLFNDEQMTLKGFLERVTHYLGERRLVIFLDQFEEYFTELSLEQREVFAGHLRECVQSYLPVWWVLAVRKEYFSDVRIFGALKPFHNEYFLPAFRPEEAKDVVIEPAALKDVSYEEGLADKILVDLRQESATIPPPQLQLVCYKLFDELSEPGGEVVITFDLYDRRRGRGNGISGAAGILNGHLSRVLDQELTPKERKVASRVLEELVTSDKRRIKRRIDELENALNPEQIAALEPVLVALYDNRLVRRELDENDQYVYELAHDYLTVEIEIDPGSMARKEARELLAQETRACQKGLLIPRDRLEILCEHRDVLAEIDGDLAACLLKSAVAFESMVEDWAVIAVNLISDDQLREILKDASGKTMREVFRGLGTAWQIMQLVEFGSKNAFVRIRAAKKLGELGDQRAVEPLISALKDDNWDVREGAARALGQLGNERAVEPLIATLKDEAGYIRMSTAGALGQLGDERAIEPLIAALKDENWHVRAGAAGALGQLGDERAVEPLMATLKDEDEDVRQGAAGASRQLGDGRAVKPLMAALKDEDEDVRRGAAWAFGQLGDGRAVKPLIAALKDQDGDVRQRAARALRQLGDERAIEPLIAALKDEDEDVRQGAAEALGQLGDERAVEPLIAALKGDNLTVHRGAAGALGQLGEPAVEPLIAALKDEDEDVRRGAAWAFGRLGDERAVEPLIAALRDENLWVRTGAAGALGQLGDGRAVKPLIAALKDENWHVRAGAAWAFGQLGDERAIEPLIAALKDQDGYVRRGVAGALGQLGDERAVEPLIAALKDRYLSVCDGASEALSQLGEPAIEPLIAALKDKDGGVRQGAAWALGKLGDERAVEPLFAALKDQDRGVRQGAAKALKKLGWEEK